MGNLLSRAAASNHHRLQPLLFFSIAWNLSFLIFYKYAQFLCNNVNHLLHFAQLPGIHPIAVTLPIGISFYTFTQIAFLVDCSQKKVVERNFIHYILFVSYFPHLIAGPILHHQQMMPQFARPETYRIDLRKIAQGIAILTIGLGKKLLLADPLGTYADLVFKNAGHHFMPHLFLSWFGVVAYACQIYFDFSGYSDMAVGISLMFGIVIPVNFRSPYKATSMIDFWRRWHISLSTFLRDYLYIPLGGNRLGKPRRYLNLLITMVLGGLWHGANWTFVLWGLLHGLFLGANHAWEEAIGKRLANPLSRLTTLFTGISTFISVCLAWVLFRASDLNSAWVIYRGMFDLNGISLPGRFSSKIGTVPGLCFSGFFEGWVNNDIQTFYGFVGIMTIAGIALFFLPDTQRWLPGCEMKAKPIEVGPLHGFALGLVFLISLLCLNRVSPFLYFQF